MNPILETSIWLVIVLLFLAAIERYYLPWSFNRAVKRILSRKDKADPRVRENPKYGTIICGTDGIVVRRDTTEIRMDWNWIDEIYAYKIDTYTTDLVCLAIISKTHSQAVEIHEEMKGYYDAQSHFIANLSGFSESWFLDVVLLACVENSMLIWNKKEIYL